MNDVTLILGDCLKILPTLGGVDAVVTDPLSVFPFHVARLAQANKVFKLIRFHVRIKVAKWANVVNGDRLSNHLLTICARSIVSFDGGRANQQPPFATIGCNAAYPQRRVFARLLPCHEISITTFRTKPIAGNVFVLSLQPRLYLKRLPTVGAVIQIANYHVQRLCLFASKSIRRAFALSKRVTNQVIVWHLPVVHVPLAATLEGTKSGFSCTIGLYGELLSTHLTNQFNHVAIIPQVIDNRTIGFAVVQPRLFADRPPTPETMPLFGEP